MKRAIIFAIFCAALAGSIGGELLRIKMSQAARNSGGTYSLPAGNPVVSGTTISSTVHNNTLNDIATEITDSLDRSGHGGMLAPLALQNGSAGAPALDFISETTSGLYRAGAHDLRLAINGVASARFANDMGLSAAGLGSAVNTSTATNGNVGVYGLGGSTGTGGDGVVGIATTGSGSARTGGYFVGGSGGGAGGIFTGGTGNGQGVSGTGAGTGVGATLANGTAATGGTRQDALVLTNGDIKMDGITNPTSTTAMTNRLTPKNLPKVWGLLSADGAGNCSVSDGFNITSCVVDSSGTFTVAFASGLANSNYAVFGTASSSGPKVFYVATASTGTMTFKVYGSDFTTQTNCHGVACTVSYELMGAQ